MSNSAQSRRDVGLVFLGASQVAGVGDPKALGWVGRVVARSQSPDIVLTTYNLGVRGATSADSLDRFRAETPARFDGRAERRLVVSLGTEDIAAGVSIARHRLNLATILDDAASVGLSAFGVGPAPAGSGEQLNAGDRGVRRGGGRRLRPSRVPLVDCYRPLVEHEQWVADLAVSPIPAPPQAGYGMIAWLVLNNGWREWLDIAGDQ